MRTKKTGAALDIYVMSKCMELLEALPSANRMMVIQWLARREQDLEPFIPKAAE